MRRDEEGLDGTMGNWGHNDGGEPRSDGALKGEGKRVCGERVFC